jgi:HK97 family phage portal protein
MDNTSMTLGYAGFNGFNIVDSNGYSGFLPPAINAYSVLTIPSYWRASNFLANNLMAFPRTVVKAGVKVAHRADGVLSGKPNQYQNGSSFWRTLWFHATHYGAGFAKIVNNGGRTSLHNLMPDTVVPYRMGSGEPDQWTSHPEGWEQWYFLRTTKEILHSSEVIHISGISYNGMTGFNPVVYLRDTFQRALMQDQYYSRFLQKGTIVRGSIEIPTGVNDQQAAEILKLISQKHQGVNADNDVLILSGGAKLNNQTLSPKDSELNAMLHYTERQIAQITGVPPQFLYEFTDAKYNDSIEQMGALVVRDTFGHWVEAGGDELSSKLLTDQEYAAGIRIVIDPDALSKADTQTLSTTVIAERTAGIRTANEARAALGLPKSNDPAADKLEVLGSTAGKAAGSSAGAPEAIPATKEPQKASSTLDDGRQAYAALEPILAEACSRVDIKTDKAFASREGKPKAELLPWGNVFAEQQRKYAREALEVVATAFQKLGQQPFDAAKVAERYAGTIRKRLADGSITTLLSLIEGNNGQE